MAPPWNRACVFVAQGKKFEESEDTPRYVTVGSLSVANAEYLVTCFQESEKQRSSLVVENPNIHDPG